MDEVFVTQAKPVEAGSVDLMSWDDDSTDGPSVPDKDPPAVFRKRADSTEGETFPRPVDLVEIEAPITVTQKEKVQSEPAATGHILDLDDEVCSCCIITLSLTSVRSHWLNTSGLRNRMSGLRRKSLYVGKT